jgi:hypothetical protein
MFLILGLAIKAFGWSHGTTATAGDVAWVGLMVGLIIQNSVTTIRRIDPIDVESMAAYQAREIVRDAISQLQPKDGGSIAAERSEP